MTVNNYKTTQIKDLLKTVFTNNRQVLFAYLFGSYARNESTPLSDIDIAIYVKDSAQFSFNDKLAIYADCCRALHLNDVDLIVINQTRNLILQDEIIRQGELIYLQDKKAYDDYELKTLHLSCDFKWQRKMEIGL